MAVTRTTPDQNLAVAGTLAVAGATTLAGALGVTGALDTGTCSDVDAFYVEAKAGLAIPADLFQVMDLDAAAGETALYVASNGIFNLYLTSTCAGNASVYIETGTDAAKIVVIDSDSPAGGQLYMDEDATLGSRLLADLSAIGGVDGYIPTSDGTLVKVTHVASPETNGVAIYIDDNGATVDERLKFVSPTGTDATDQINTDHRLVVPVTIS